MSLVRSVRVNASNHPPTCSPGVYVLGCALTSPCHNLHYYPPPSAKSFPAGDQREALFGHAGNAWCLYVMMITDVSADK